MADGWASFGATAYVPPLTSADGGPPPRPLVATLEAKNVLGQMTATLTAASGGRVRYVNRITVSTPGSTTAVRAYVYVGAAVPEAVVMGTRSGQLDYALEDPPVFVPSDTPLTVQWDVGPTRALARIEYTEV
ncbi:hypothetical protein ACIA8O_39910 [Kitasatospora sp. NPDC051853]|uniref:hypothetical protein n=1 Tax=Kitasatospora sp. NPDC051853 TaxID=3364058 RepID=UPI0037AF3C88